MRRPLSRARAAGSDLVIIDTPPGRNTEAPADVEVADLVLPRTTRLARSAEKPAAVVPVVLHRFNVNRDSSLRGKTAQELQPDSKVVAKNALWTEVCAELQKTDPATVHKVGDMSLKPSGTDEFLGAMQPQPADLPEPPASALPPPEAPASIHALPVQRGKPMKAKAPSRASLKHFGGYVGDETLEKIALLRIRLKKDNSQLIELAIDDLYRKHAAKRAPLGTPERRNSP